MQIRHITIINGFGARIHQGCNPLVMYIKQERYTLLLGWAMEGNETPVMLEIQYAPAGEFRTYLKIAALADTALKTGSKCSFTGV